MKKLLFIAVVFIASSCGILSTNIDHFCADWENPCTNSQDCVECKKWKEENPKEYKRYSKRVKDYHWIETCPE